MHEYFYCVSSWSWTLMSTHFSEYMFNFTAIRASSSSKVSQVSKCPSQLSWAREEPQSWFSTLPFNSACYPISFTSARLTFYSLQLRTLGSVVTASRAALGTACKNFGQKPNYLRTYTESQKSTEAKLGTKLS